MTLTYLIRRGGANIGRSAVPDRGGREALNTMVRQRIRALLNDRHFLARGGTLAFPCSHLYHQDARFQHKQRPLSRQTVSSLKGRDHAVASAAIAEGLEVTLCPYMIETCADGAWQLDHFPTQRERAALDDRMAPWGLEEALAIRASSDDAGDFDVVWVDPPPHFNGQPTMYPEIAEGRSHPVDPDLPALAHLHACEYSATGYFGNEGSDIDLYIYCALHVAFPKWGEEARAVARTRPFVVPSSARHGHKRKVE